MNPRVKICGITQKEDALLASSLGATAIGFVFAKSLRQVSTQQVAEIVAELPNGLSTVGVFADQDISIILKNIDASGINSVQLHGKETPEFVADLKSQRPEVSIYKAIGISEKGLELNPEDYKACDYLLFDSLAPRELKDHERRPLLFWKHLSEVKTSKPYYVAGGLRAQNVTEVLQNLNPYGVDVSSGVESEPGRKSPSRMKAFFEAVGVKYV